MQMMTGQRVESTWPMPSHSMSSCSWKMEAIKPHWTAKEFTVMCTRPFPCSLNKRPLNKAALQMPLSVVAHRANLHNMRKRRASVRYSSQEDRTDRAMMSYLEQRESELSRASTTHHYMIPKAWHGTGFGGPMFKQSRYSSISRLNRLPLSA